jgi:hypothetical protein
LSRTTFPARPQVIEDACAFAWLELVARQPEPTNVVGWLRVVTRREAIRLARYDRRVASLTGDQPDARAAREHPTRAEAREALGLVGRCRRESAPS